MNKKKVQNAIKTQQRKGTVNKPAVVNQPVTYKPTVIPPVPLGAIRRTLSVVRPAVPTKPPGIQPVALKPQIAPRPVVTNSAQSVQRLQPKPQVTQRVYTPVVPSSLSRASATPGRGGLAANTGKIVAVISLYSDKEISESFSV